MSRNLSLNCKPWGNHHQKNSQKYLCSKHYKKSLNNTLNTNGGTDGQTLGRLKRIIIVALKTCKPKCVSPILESVPVWKSIPEFLASNIESIEKGLCVSFVVRTITMRLYLHFLSLTLNMRRESTCVRLQNENHPLHIILPKLEEVQHDYQLKSGASYRLRPICKTKRPSALKIL